MSLSQSIYLQQIRGALIGALGARGLLTRFDIVWRDGDNTTDGEFAFLKKGTPNEPSPITLQDGANHEEDGTAWAVMRSHYDSAGNITGVQIVKMFNDNECDPAVMADKVASSIDALLRAED